MTPEMTETTGGNDRNGRALARTGYLARLFNIGEAETVSLTTIERRCRMDRTTERKATGLAVVTGASRGIGRALSAALVAEGWQVLAASRSGAAPEGAQGVACDLATGAGRAALVEAARSAGRPVHLLVNNAGLQEALDFAAATPEAAPAIGDRAAMEVALNLTAPVALTAGMVPLMARPGGTIVNVTSLVARHPKPSAPVYSATKAGLASFTRSMRRQLAPLGLRVVEVVPPLVATDMTAGRDAGALGAGAMAAEVLAGLAAGRRTIAPGKAALVLRLDRVAPWLVARKMAAM